MKAVRAELDKGSSIDPIMLFIGITTIIIGFLTMYDTDFWEPRTDLWGPIVGVGCMVIILHIVLRVIRPKLVINLLEDKGGRLVIRQLKQITFSGWVELRRYEDEKSKVKTIKVFDFTSYTTVGRAGGYWVCIEFNTGGQVEFSLDKFEIIQGIIYFVRTCIPDAELVVDDRLKI